MAGRRQVGTGITLFLLMFALPAAALGLSRPGGGWQAATEAATLIATALLLAVAAHRMGVVPVAGTVTGRMTGPDASAAPVLSRLSPDAPGRPEQPRAPGQHR
jgi:hypothetical protein